MGRFNSNHSTPRTINLAGGKAYSFSAEVELLHAVLTTFLNDKFYEKGGDRIVRIQQLIQKVHPIYVAQLAYVARTEFNLRSVSHLLLAELARHKRGDGLVWRTFEKTIIRPDDILEIAALLEMKLPKQAKRGFRRALLKFSPYQLAKYRGEGKNIKMVDIFNLVHPNPRFATHEQRRAWADLMIGRLKNTDTWETRISAAKGDSIQASREWSSLISEKKLGYMALIRNLNNILKSNPSDELIREVYMQLTNREAVKKSKLLPFRFVTAYQNVKGSRPLTDAISIAMDHAVDNVPQLFGRTLIAIDMSGSMTSSYGASDAAIKKASIFAAALSKANPLADVIGFDNELYELNVSSRVPVIDIAEKIEKEAQGGGTDTRLVFFYAATKKKQYDRIIILSDNESWKGDVQSAYEKYRREINADPFVYAIDIEGYGTSDIKGGKVFHLTGWSANLLDYIGKIEDGESLLNHVKSIKI